MAKTKYKGEETDRQVYLMARDEGLNDREIANNLGIHHDTFYQWIKKHPAFSDAVKKGRELSIDKVENALFKEATGYWTEETKTYIQEGKNGEKTKKIEKSKKFIRPNVTAQIYITKNRRPAKWPDKQDFDLNHKGKVESSVNHTFSRERLRELLNDTE